jgi:hypothetical protein
MAAGKNKAEKGAYIFWDDVGTSARNITGDLVRGSLSIGDEFEGVDMTGVSEELVNYLDGHRSVEVSARFHANDTLTTGASTVLNLTTNVAGTFTLQIGDAGASPGAGDLELEGEMILVTNDFTVDGNKIVHDARWLPTGTGGFAWGTVA